MQILCFIPILMIFAGAALSYAGILRAMAGWVICALGVLLGLGLAITIMVTEQSHMWVFAIIAALPAALAIPKVIIDLRYPRINDVTTNIENPPEFVAALGALANINRNMSYPKNFVSVMQDKYPNIRPLILEEPPELVFQRAENLAKNQTGWIVTHSVTQKNILEGEVRTSLLRFVDDFVIRVSERDGKSIVDMRSKSREGLLDAGVNAKRIQAFLALLAEN